MRNYQRLVPANSFMGRYLSYMQSQETAEAFDFWSALWVISTACGRFTHVARPRAPVYLNMFVVLVGESGVARKSTAIRSATSLARHCTGGASKVGLIDAKVTPEKLEEILHDRTAELGTAQLAIAIPELAVFLGTEQYIAHMPVLLTDLYDCPDERHSGGTIARGATYHHKVWLNFISASTPIWLLKTVNPNVIEGGFTSRCYFIISNTPKSKIAWPSELDSMLYKDLCDDVKIMAMEARSKGPIQITPSALMVFTKWYGERGHSLDSFKQSFEAREDAHILRVAGLLSVNDGSYVISRGHVRIAIRLIEGIKHSSSLIFETTEQRTKFAQALDIIRSQLVSTGMDPIQRGRLYLKCRSYLSNAEFLTLLEVMHEVGAIQRFEFKSDRGRPADYIRGTNLLLSNGLGAAVLDRFM